MGELKRHFSKLVFRLEDRLDGIALSLRKRLHMDKPLQIITYRSYGTVNRLYLTGRVLRDKGIRKSIGKDSVWKNLVEMYKRFQSAEAPFAQLKIEFQGKSHVVTTNAEGYFTLDIHPENPIEQKNMWLELEVELIAAPFGFRPGLKTTASILIPTADAEYGIISDIDDTVVKTTATSLIAMARNTFFHNAHSRLPFAGVSEFYCALQLGRNGKRNNPFFYVSSSPWNLYDLLVDFLDINNIPEGPLLLRDFGLDENKESSNHMGHKLREIQNILLAYPHLNFILIGDSGQEDPKIYRLIVSRFPGRILAIYIRDVKLSQREKIAIEISKELMQESVEMIIVDNTVQAAKHAAARGLIYTTHLQEIVKDKMQDKGELPGKLA
jgi:phosphatidate phosphatase APP1